jgi:hypothetical protein
MGGGEPQNLDLKLTLTIFFENICEFHKNNNYVNISNINRSVVDIDDDLIDFYHSKTSSYCSLVRFDLH